MALFMTPEQVRAAQNTPLSSSGVQDVLRGSLFNLGQTGGRQIAGLFGGETRTPAEIHAANVQAGLAGLDFTDPSTVATTMNQLQGQGNTQEALALAGLLPKATTPKVTGVGKPFLQSIKDPTNPNNFVTQWMQNFSDGTTKSIGTALQNEDNTVTAPDFSFSSPLLAEIGLDDDSRELVQKRFFETVNSEQFRDLDDIEGVKKQGLEGHIVKLANQLRNSQRLAFSQQLATAQASGATLPKHLIQSLAKQAIMDSDTAIQSVYDEFVTSGNFRKWFEQGGLGDPEVTGAPAFSNPSLTDTQEMTADEQKRAAALQKIADRTGKLVFGNPDDGQFSILNLKDPKQQTQRRIFKDTLMQVATKRMDPAMAVRTMMDQGFNFSPQALPSHVAVWQLMAEDETGFAARQLARVDDGDVFGSQGFQELKAMEASGNYQAFATAKEIMNYLENMGQPRKPKQSQSSAGGLKNFGE